MTAVFGLAISVSVAAAEPVVLKLEQFARQLPLTAGECRSVNLGERAVMPADITLDGNLGMPFLKDYLVTLDLSAGRLWIARNPATPPTGMGEASSLPPPGK